MGLPQHQVTMTPEKFIAWKNQQPDNLQEYAPIGPGARSVEVFRRRESDDWPASERGLIPKRLYSAADLDTVCEDV